MTRSLVNFVSRTDAALLERLRSSHPNADEIFGVARTRDISAPKEMTNNAEEVRQSALVDLLILSIRPVITELDKVLGFVYRRMKLVNRVKLVGALVATLSGLVVATSKSFAVAEGLDELILAIFATFGGIVVIFSSHFEQAPNGVRIASAEEYGKLSQMKEELMRINLRAGRHEFYPLNSDQIEEMIGTLDKYAAHIDSLEVR